MPVTADGCHTMNDGGASSDAAPKNAGQSRPGARFTKSACVQGLFAFFTSSESARETWVFAMAFSSSKTRAAFAAGWAMCASSRRLVR